MIVDPEGHRRKFNADFLDNFANENNKESINNTARKMV